MEFSGELDAFIDAVGVVEGAEHQCLAEIAVVDEVGCDLVVNVDPEIEVGAVLCRRLAASERNVLIDAGVEIMRALRQHRAVALAGRRRAGRAVEQGDIRRSGLDQYRRREVARVAGVEGRVVERLVGEADARAELVGVDELPHLVEAQTAIDGEFVGDFPLVLGIDAGEPTDR